MCLPQTKQLVPQVKLMVVLYIKFLCTSLLGWVTCIFIKVSVWNWIFYTEIANANKFVFSARALHHKNYLKTVPKKCAVATTFIKKDLQTWVFLKLKVQTRAANQYETFLSLAEMWHLLLFRNTLIDTQSPIKFTKFTKQINIFSKNVYFTQTSLFYKFKGSKNKIVWGYVLFYFFVECLIGTFIS